MPSWKTHIAFGFVFIVALLFVAYKYFNFVFALGIKEMILAIPIITLMALSPDLDVSSSKIRGFATSVLIILAVVLIYVKHANTLGLIVLLLLAVLWLLPLFGNWKHRGHMHSMLFILILSAVVFYFFDWKLATLGFLAALSHLVADRAIKIW